jgi:hypothetical protein
MRVSKFINWNTLKGKDWGMQYINLLPVVQISYENDSCMGDDYCKEMMLRFEWLCITVSISLLWGDYKLPDEA